VAMGQAAAADDTMLYDCEQAEHMAAWGGLADEQSGSRTLSLDAPEVTPGDKAHKIALTGTGSDGPGIANRRAPADWPSYEALKFEVWSVNALNLHVRIDDDRSTDHASRFNYSIQLKQKKTLVQIPVESIQRSINASNVKLVCIYLTKPPA